MSGHLTAIVATGLMVIACGKGDDGPAAAPDAVGATSASDAAAASVAPLAPREKILALAVAGECLRKEDLSAEQMTEAMLARYRAHAISLATYTQEMRRLGRDAAFRADLAAGIEDCSDVVAALIARDADAGPTVPSDTPDAGSAAPTADAVAPQAADTGGFAIAALANGGEPDAVDAASGASDDAGPTFEADITAEAPLTDVVVEAADAGGEAVDEAAPGADSADVVAADDAVDAADAEAKPPPLRWDGVYSGTISGSGKGTVRITIKNRRIAGATARVNGVTFQMKGRISGGGRMNLGTRKGRDYIRIIATLNARKKRITGTWEGAVASRLLKGSVSAKR